MNRYKNKVFSPSQFKTQESSQMLMSETHCKEPEPSVFIKSKWPLILIPGMIAAITVVICLLN